ncbi:MAG TPA: type II CAAX endopeptidase family protein [Terriglobales bacterium]|nr:type II CAAX endopeptidase family protein [Terriglobales bacterium]
MTEPQQTDRLDATGSPDQPSPDSTFPTVETLQESVLHKIFVGSGGIRAVWRFLLYLVMAAAFVLALGFVIQGSRAHGALRLWIDAATEAIVALGAIVPAFIMARIEKRRFDDYGLPLRQAFGALFWVGSVWGIVAISLLLLGIRGLHGFYFGHLALHGIRIFKFAFYWGVFFLLVGFFEEFLFRGYTQFTLASGIGFWPSAVILSVAFGAVHTGNSGEAWVGLLSAGLIGFFFCLTLRRTGNLWFAVGFHFSFDWGETFLYSVPNSGTREPGHLLNSSFQGPLWLTGGSVGPEGSVLVFVLIAALWIVFDRMYPVAKYALVRNDEIRPSAGDGNLFMN